MSTTKKIIKPLTVNDLARVMGVQPDTVRKWRTDGTGPSSYKVGRTIRFDVKDVERWVEQRKQQEGR